jgi:S1-C subfamily serine protease
MFALAQLAATDQSDNFSQQLGVKIVQLSDDGPELSDDENTSVVADVQPDGVAAKWGLQKGDQIQSVNFLDARPLYVLAELFGAESKKNVFIVAKRNGKIVDLGSQ